MCLVTMSSPVALLWLEVRSSTRAGQAQEGRHLSEVLMVLTILECSPSLFLPN